jgi:L-alanine-DL-glutamate epimerase-like enolase superfamily enzyme
MELRAWEEKLPTKRPFVISTGTLTAARVVFVEVAAEGARGVGEAAPSLRVCGETPAGVLAFLEAVRPLVEAAGPGDWKGLLEALDAGALGNPAAKAALDMALLDLAGKLQGKPVHRLLGLRAAERPTSATVVLDAPEAMAAEARSHAAQGFRHLKLKLGEPRRDLARVKAVRDAVPEATLRCDANTGWSEAQALRLVAGLDRLEVELLEQPVPRPFRAELKRIAKAADLPVLADEACLGLEDAEHLARERYADGLVLKLMKCGGLWQARQMLGLARREGLQVMAGCMVESSVGITAASHLLGAVRWADLDGAWLLAQDPWRGARVEAGRIRSPAGAGLGVGPVR